MAPTPMNSYGFGRLREDMEAFLRERHRADVLARLCKVKHSYRPIRSELHAVYGNVRVPQHVL